jgi:hypothetical protein
MSSMKTCVLAVDPGYVSGVAWHRILTGPAADRDEFGCVELSREEFGPWLDYEIAYKGSIDQVVVEQFNITQATPKSSYVNNSSEVIGQVKYIASEYDVPVLEQTRENGKSLGTNERLKRLGWHRQYMVHATDAARHLLAYRLGEGWMPSQLDQKSNSI